MLKKLSLIFCTFLLLLVTFSLNAFYQNYTAITTFKNHVIRERKLTTEVVHHYLHGSPNQKENARNLIITTSLKNLNYEKWIDYREYIDLQIYIGDVMPNNGEELIVVLNLSKDLAAITIYSPVNQEFVFVHSLENLLPVEKIELFEIPALGYYTLNVFQILDERLGAYILERFVESYTFMNEKWHSIWKKTIYMEEIYNQQWINPQANANQWIKIIENNDIRFLPKPIPEIHVTVNRSKLTALKNQFPLPEDFHLEESTKTHETYYWSSKYHRYIQKEGILKECATPIAIIEDLEAGLEAYLGFAAKHYKITYLDGRIDFIKKESLLSE
ncbi:hypothetical protein [Geosporobacter ferrireducens]|uniref:CAP-associated domain-containing protein n=1 Tax=Geosporobacter ferrireducens TaxID=1424294 RepID=A0A1D8GCE5_9FIRM|nr:hypothetical protein [Geosporobacter ferrireducens]AOT68562.1 hypothetical protein Gferi_02495 [Geosporobacter ferrireducens]MTI54028.1 hypothetical protein [Geosporobacter ferrireducens]